MDRYTITLSLFESKINRYIALLIKRTHTSVGVECERICFDGVECSTRQIDTVNKRTNRGYQPSVYYTVSDDVFSIFRKK